MVSDARQSTFGSEEYAVVERECQYYDGCVKAAEFAVNVLIYGEGEQEVVSCESCAKEHVEVDTRSWDDDVRELSAADRWEGVDDE